jgi:hypothetical protein
VARGVSERDLKRAYLALIRRYKPEHAPEEFRRIREAYESIRDRGTGFGPAGWFVPPPAGVVLTEWDELPPAAASPGPAPEALWDLACTGDLGHAYAQLRALADGPAPAAGLFARLYWLQVVLPALEPGRPALDWLVRGVLHDASAWSLRELLRREVYSQPSLAMSESWLRLMAGGVRSDLLVEAAGLRWRAATALKRWDVIGDDIGRLRAMSRVPDDRAWLPCLIAAASRLAWCDRPWPDRTRPLLDEIKALDYLHDEFSAELLELDHALESARAWNKMKASVNACPRALHALMPVSWQGIPAVVHPLVRAYAEDLARRPFQALAFCDDIRAKVPAVFGHLTTLLHELLQTLAHPEDARAPEELSRLVVRFLAPGVWREHAAFRTRLLAFCLKYAVPPDAVASSIASRPDFAYRDGTHLSQVIADDWPVRHVYQSCECSSLEPLNGLACFGDAAVGRC